MQINTRIRTLGIVLVVGIFSIIANGSILPISYALDTVTFDLSDGRENTFSKGTTVYEEVSNIETNSSQLQGIETGSGYTYNSVADDSISIAFPAKIPDPSNPNRMNVDDVSIRLDVNSIETKDDGLKTFYAEPGFLGGSIGDVQVASGIVEQTSDDEAKAILILE